MRAKITRFASVESERTMGLQKVGFSYEVLGMYFWFIGSAYQDPIAHLWSE